MVQTRGTKLMPVYRLVNVIQNKNGNYTFRKVVPKELRQIVGKTEIKISLGTTDFHIATINAKEHEAEATRLIENARKLLAGEDIRISAEHLEEIARTHSAEQAQAGRLASLYTPKAARKKAKSTLNERMNLLHLPTGGSDNEIIDGMVRQILDESKLPHSDFNTNAVRDILVQARWNSLKLQRKGLQGKAWGPPPTTSSVQTSAPTRTESGGPLLSVVMEDYFKDVTPTAQTEHESRQSVTRFSALHGDQPIASITADQLRAFRDALPDWGDRKANGRQPLKGATVNKHLNMLNAILRWASKRDIIDKNPMLAVTRPKQHDSIRRRPWSTEDLVKIFNGPWYDAGQTRSGLFWLPLLSLYSGARAGELAQLRSGDISQIDGVWVFEVTSQSALLDTEERTTTKNEGSVRTIPVHQKLEEIGFISFVSGIKQAHQTRLFPEFQRGSIGSVAKIFSNTFSDYTKDLGINKATQSFHSFRHNFKDRCREAGIPEEASDQITGHSNPSTGRSYGTGYSELKLKSYIDQVSYPGLNLSHLHP